jgi:hypothetical protein
MVFVLCWVGFLYHICFGIAIFALPELTMKYFTDAFSITLPASDLDYFIPRMMAILLFPVGLAYLLALIYPDASHPLLMVATSGKVLGVLYALAAFFLGTLKPQFVGGVIMDGIFALAGIYAVVVTRKQKGATSFPPRL